MGSIVTCRGSQARLAIENINVHEGPSADRSVHRKNINLELAKKKKKRFRVNEFNFIEYLFISARVVLSGV